MAAYDTTCEYTATRRAAAEIAASTTVPQVLRALGVRVRNSKRSDCALCKGKSRGTLAFTERLWRCHRCNVGGDVFSLVRKVKCCDFPGALRFVAELAGIRLEDRRSADSRRELDAQKRRRERVEDAANMLASLEHALRRYSRECIHDAERKSLKVRARLAALVRGQPERFRGEQEGLWLTLQGATALLNTHLPTYTLLSFGAPDERVRFVLHPELRDEIISSVRWAGSVRTADGRKIEVLA